MVAAVQEFGAVGITAKIASAMAIPVGEQLDRRGVRKFGSPRAARTQFTLFAGPRGLMGFPKGSKQNPRLQFLLRNRPVNVPARPFALPEVETAAQRLVARLGAVIWT
jgi:hypothetical protein